MSLYHYTNLVNAKYLTLNLALFHVHCKSFAVCPFHTSITLAVHFAAYFLLIGMVDLICSFRRKQTVSKEDC